MLIRKNILKNVFFVNLLCASTSLLCCYSKEDADASAPSSASLYKQKLTCYISLSDDVNAQYCAHEVLIESSSTATDAEKLSLVQEQVRAGKYKQTRECPGTACKPLSSKASLLGTSKFSLYYAPAKK
jgi:hypothetical protein